MNREDAGALSVALPQIVARLTCAPLLAVVLAIAGCATHPEPGTRTLVGHFTFLDTSVPGCGILALASRATFREEGSGKEVRLAVPCIEMQFTEDDAGRKTPLAVGERYTIVVRRDRPTPDTNSPYEGDRDPWFLFCVSK